MAIQYIDRDKLFVLTSQALMYVFEITRDGYPVNLYYGKNLRDFNDLPLGDIYFFRNGTEGRVPKDCLRREYTANGNGIYYEASVEPVFSDGIRGCELVYKTHFAEGNHLEVVLEDKVHSLEVSMHYTTYDDVNIIERYTVIKNNGTHNVVLKNAASATLYMEDFNEDYYLTSLPGNWASEYAITRQQIKKGKYVLETRDGYCNSQIAPYFAIDRGADENSGEVWFGLLEWCGNNKITVEHTNFETTVINAGINNYDFNPTLNPDQSFETPILKFGYTNSGFGGASRIIHDYQRKYILPKAYSDSTLPVLYNAWAAFELDINEEKLISLADYAKRIGAELFVVDDGWYGNSTTIDCDLGDWVVNKTKFPNGLQPLVNKVNDLGMKFGLWIEPEMVAKTSELYKQHPDWIFGYEKYPQYENWHGRYVLNLAKPEVADYIFDVIDKLLQKYNIEYLKWDSNRYMCQVGNDGNDRAEGSEAWYLYFKNLYGIFERINKKYPNIIIENCASGGLRANMSLARYCSRINRSDNQDPRDALILHHGFSFIMNPKLAGGGGHISRVPNGINGRCAPLRYRAHMGMLGSLAVGYDLRNASQDEINQIAFYVEQFKQIREIIQLGDFYTIHAPENGDYCVYQYVSKDKSKSVLFVFGINLSFRKFLPNIKTLGLSDDKVYNIKHLKAADQPEELIFKPMSGSGLKDIGLRVSLAGDYDSKLILIEEK